jgi:OmpA-OmpF porin, OOP family
MRIVYSVILFVVGLLMITSVYAQNLVPNYSFEEYTVCPGSYAREKDEFRVPGWKGFGLGTPDHYHYCSHGEAGVPYNWAGTSSAYEGDGYAGVYLWLINKDYREYLYCKLVTPMVKDTTYKIEFHYKLSSYSNYCIDRIGLLLSDTLKSTNHDKPLLIEPTFHVIKHSALTKATGLWEHARFEYKARGGESQLVVGNFSSGEDTKHYKIRSRVVAEPMLQDAAYYFIDYVSIVPKFRAAPAVVIAETNEFVPLNVSTNKNYVLSNIQFEFNSFKLLPQSFEQLNSVVNFLLDNPKLKVQISGHTDDVGSEAYNVRLSRERAKSVGDYLISQGIAKERITVIGYGKSKPISYGTLEEERALNRRVEVRFIN